MSGFPTLASTFRSHCRGEVEAEPGALGATLAECLSAGQAGWPTLPLPPLDFIAHLAQRAPLQEGKVTLAGLRGLHAGDLYLACACQRNVPPALELFEQHFLPPLAAYLRRSEPSPVVVDELCQQLREELFVGVPAGAHRSRGAAKIAHYDGRGSLKAWLRVVALRTALTRRRGERRERLQPLDDTTLLALPSGAGPELEFLRQQHEPDIKQALTEALATLPSDRVNVLRLHLLDGLTLEKIAGLYHVNRSSVKRWLDDARARLLSELRRRLQARFQLPPKDLDSLLTHLRSQLDLSLSRLLKASIAG
jgi:RNA polymerase sigma-70 factor